MAIRFYRNPGQRDSPGALPVVFLPGWGFDGRVFQLAGQTGLNWLAPDRPLDPESFDREFPAALAAHGLDRFVLVGWSMGAHLALEFARRHPEMVAELYLLALRQSWPAAEIAAIRHEFLAAPRDFLAGFYRKCFLGHRQDYLKFEATLASEYLGNPDPALLTRGLAYLAGVKAHSRPGPNTVQVHGLRDVIAPFAERAALDNARTLFLPHAGHPVFLAPEFLAAIARFGLSPGKTAIRQRFSKAAATYDAYAQTQKETAFSLDRWLAELDVMPTAVLELGCGTGAFTRILAERFPQASILGLDFSAAMISEASGKLADQPRVSFLCRDAEDFLGTTAGQAFDLIASNATLQWFDDLTAALAGIARVLVPGGYLIGSVFGPESLRELAHGLGQVRGRPVDLPAAGFPGLEQLAAMLGTVFVETEIKEMWIPRRYESLRDLLAHMRRTGTTGGRRSAPVLTRAGLHELDAWFVREQGGYVLTHQVFLIRGRKER